MTTTRPHRNPRGLSAAVLIGITTVLLTPSGPSTAAPPPVPTVASVTVRLDALAKQTMVLTAQYNTAQADVRATQIQANIAQRAAKQASAEYQKARAQFSRLVTARYEATPLSVAGTMFTSESGQSYLNAMSTLSLLTSHRAELVAQVSAAEAKARTAQHTARSLLADAQARRNALDAQHDTIVAQTQTVKKLLATVTLAQQQQSTATAHAVQAGTTATQQAAQCTQQYAPTTTAVGSCGGLSGYVNPFAQGSWRADRTDQGVDWNANQPQPMVAIGDGVVTYSNSQQNDWPGGAFLIYGLTTGSHAGLYVFVAENLTNLAPVGTTIKAGQQIATTIPGGPGIEIGFAAAPGTGPNVATPYNGAPDGTQTAGGKAFARFLIELGATPLQPPRPGPDRP